MAKYYITVLVVRVLQPAGLLLSISLRPFGLSLIYLLLYLIAPLVPTPHSTTIQGCSGKWLLINVVVSFLMLLTHAAWHGVLAGFQPYGSLLQDYPIIRTIGRNLGLVSFAKIEPFLIVRYLSPEIAICVSSLLVYLLTRKLVRDPNSQETPLSKYRLCPRLVSAGKYLCLILLMLSGIMRPSVTSGIYFLVFMGSATAWALGRRLERGFAVISRCLMAIMACHVAGLLVYQNTWLTEMYPPEEDMARYFGLTKLVTLRNSTDVEDDFKYTVEEDQKWGTLASPLVILITYFILALESRELFKPKMLRSVSPSKRLTSFARNSSRTMHQDSIGSVVVVDHDSDEPIEPTLSEDIMQAVIDFFDVMIRSSYIATTITMMAWSIIFHSWLSFVFLMWANIVWLMQDQRSFMLKTSPILVCYAMFLLITQYIYGMDLTPNELPEIKEVNLAQIGFSRPKGEPCVPLLIKSLFTCMFWLTLRQWIQEMRQKKQSALLTDMAAPMQLTVSTAASVLEGQREQETRSRLLRKVGEVLRTLCARYWIYVVVIMLFVIGITGERMTIFRIIYMFLFLAFILMFQISWYWWRRLMYIFWITVIIYSMINLILIYIYQFDNFSKTIEEYLMISERLQNDLGLSRYNPADLFVKLLTPTSFLIITIMQVHYFHKDFMELSATKGRLSSGPSRVSSRRSTTVKDDASVPPLPLEEERHAPLEDTSFTDAGPSVTTSMRRKASSRARSGMTNPSSTMLVLVKRQLLNLKAKLMDWTDKIFVFLEIHLIKIIMLALMLLCVANVCAMHVPIFLLICPGLLLRPRRQRHMVLFISILISIYFMAKMVYQIDYIQHSFFAVTCQTPTLNGTEGNATTFNNAGWIGFHKATHEKPLVVLVKSYIALIALFTFYSLVMYRQKSIRENLVEPRAVRKDRVIFPEVNRVDADKDLPHCLKYLINYGFYKFGVEITLICLMGVIGSRMDLYAVLYAGWLLVLVSISRMQQSFVWHFFTAFITFIVPFQYLLAVGFLPQFCINFPWWGDDERTQDIRTWLFLPYAPNPPHAIKLIFDFFLLLFASRQLRVFSLERSRGDAYAGGSNKEDIGGDWETPTFVNPVPDFLSYVSSWLDVIKRMVFLGMLWMTLAIMFMTGTSRVNLFSMGYLVGSFIFLWQGTDFYLLPKKSILRWWSWLLLYNVSVVGIKALLQIPGCMFNEIMEEHACWLVQLLGIGCVDKFAGGSVATFIEMPKNHKESTCMVPQEDIGLAWDGVCFAFLILQRRLFRSYYFYRVIDESKATTILASRGAELIEELRQKQMGLQEEQETKILEKIKVKMERIKANQRKMQIVAKEPRHHDDGSETEPCSTCGVRRREYTKRHEAIRSGDYYMFDEFDDTDLHDKDDEEDSDEDVPKEMGFGKEQRSMSPRSSRIVREADVNVTTSDQEMDEFAEQEGQNTFHDKLRDMWETVCAFVQSILVTLTRHVIKYSRDYRYISRTLTQEKKRLKEREGFGIGLRENAQMRWEPLPDAIVIENKDVTMLEEQDDSLFKHGKNPFIHLMYALWYAVLAHTDVVCYMMVFINQIQSATILSIPLPLMVFLWGTLTIPRPTKTFWVTLIAYTEVIVLIKSMFQFEILPWNQKAIPENMPFTAPRIIGIERKSNYAIYDLLLLLIIFLHRFMLKSLGLWKESAPEIELRDDMEYTLSPEDTQQLVEGQGEEVGRKYVKLHDKEGPEGGPGSGEGSHKSTSAEVKPELEDGVGDTPKSEGLRRRRTSGKEPEAGPSKPADDDHYQVNDDDEPIIAVTTTIESPYKHFPKIIVLSLRRYLRPAERFFRRMTAAGARVTADVYAYMFLCDFFNFLVVIFGFAAFGTHQGDGGVQAYLEENKVPIPFLVMLILQFGLIVIDRALYLRKYMLGKILFQYALVIGVHIWMFFVLPFITERTFNALLPPPMWYMLKCIYLLLSAYQIRCGYPRRIIGNFLCKSYRFLNMVAFRGFMAVPFVFELRTLMDWIWTDTSMTLVDWLKMEDIFASVYLLKCSRYVEDEFPAPRGVKKTAFSKYTLGGGVLAFVIAIIWFPLVFFAFGNTVGEPNPPKDVTVKIRIGPFLPVYQMSAQSHNIDPFTEQDYTQLSNLYGRDRTAQTFLSNYMYNDVAVVTINPNSTSKWTISPPELERLEREALSNASLAIRFTFVITHETNAAANPPTIEDHREVHLAPYVGGKRNPEREMLTKLLSNSTGPDDWLNVTTLFPKFLKVFNKGSAKAAYQLIPSPTDAVPDERLYRDVQLRLERQGGDMYWRVRESCARDEVILSSIPRHDCSMLIMYTFNDKLFPETLNFISGSGIIGLYTTFVFLASRVIRGFFSGIYTKIMFDDLPNVDRVLQLCLDIYLVREAVELTLEEDLFAKLVFLYRSPETMIKWTRPKEEEGDQQRALPPP